MIEIGRIVGVFGLRGHVKVAPSTDFPARFEVGTRVQIGSEPAEILECRWQKGRPVLLLDIARSIDAAELLKGARILAEDTPPELEADEYLTRDLIGLNVVTVDGEPLGTVDDVERYPAQDVFVVGEIRIPAVKAFVRSLDLEKREMVVSLVYGMRPGEDGV